MARRRLGIERNGTTSLPVFDRGGGLERGAPEWVEVNREGFTARVKALPSRAELTMPINEKLIVELYSK